MRCDSRSLAIENASIVTPQGVIENGSVKVVGGIIAAVGKGPVEGCERYLDASGMYVLPGLIDLHSDAVEEEIEPRPGAFFPLAMAIGEMDKKLVACGITTMYHSISYNTHRIRSKRNNEIASLIVSEVNRLAPVLGVRTRVHARFEISNARAVPYLERLLAEGNIHLFSIMDHTPGQGQFREAASYKKLNATPGVDDAAMDEHLSLKIRDAVPLNTAYIRQLIDQCRTLGIPVASHDDDSEDKLDIVEAMGVKISEFPINMATAASATHRGMDILFGAPNVVRGGSTSGNLDARAAIRAGVGDILCSDYMPTSLVHAVFAVEQIGIPLHQAVNMASLNPARAARIDSQTGSLEAGKSADLIVVDCAGEVPRVLKTFVEGREVYATCRLSPM